jgi:dienelactone hydrolase
MMKKYAQLLWRTLFICWGWTATAETFSYQPPIEAQFAGHEGQVRLPEGAAPAEGWPLLIFSGGAGSRGLSPRRLPLLAAAFQELGVPVGLFTVATRNHLSPGADGGAPLLEAVDALAEAHPVQRNFYLAGFSRGGQFTHRFVFHAAPERVLGAAPCNPGTWTLPTGGTHGQHGSNERGTPMPPDAGGWNETMWRASLEPAKPEARQVPFLILCTTGDQSRLPPAMKFAEIMKREGFSVETSFDLPGGHGFGERSAKRVAQFVVGLERSRQSTPPGQARTTDSGEWRTWRNLEGVSVRATLLGLRGNEVMIQTEDGRPFRTQVDQFSPDDRAYLEKQRGGPLDFTPGDGE